MLIIVCQHFLENISFGTIDNLERMMLTLEEDEIFLYGQYRIIVRTGAST